jgi:serine/threonine-protein kinase
MASIGDVIGGRYKILEEIGRGGMSIVYLAMDVELKSNWVLKEIKKSKNESKYEKALREARLMSEFKCRGIPIIVNILEYEENQLAYIVMEYIPGKSLQDIMVERSNALPEDFVIHAGIEVCDILNYLHSSNPPVIHRDIKPANIIYVEKDKSFWLLDFGEAKILTDKNLHDIKATGTPEFMAPEQVSERQGGRQTSNQLSDLFSLGASLFYMVTGQISTRSNISNQYYSILDVDNKISPTFSRIVAKTMSVIPDARYSDAMELKNALIECTEEAQKKRRAAIRNIRRVAFILAGAFLMLSGGIGFRITDNVKNNQSYDSLIKSAQSESGDTSKKIDDAISAISLKPNRLEPYEILRNLYESDCQFTVEEEAKFQAVITPNKDELSKNSDYSNFAYQVGIMYLIYYTESSESYIKAIDWFSSVTDEHKEVADVYLRIGQFDRDITKKLSTGDESGEFKEQWDSLNEALSLAGKQNNDLLQMAICKKVISAMDEYCMKFKKDGITKSEMEETLQEVESYVAGFIPDTEEYLNVSGEVDFTKYYEALKQEAEQSENGSAQMNGTDALFMEIYPFLSTVPVEIEKTYR